LQQQSTFAAEQYDRIVHKAMRQLAEYVSNADNLACSGFASHKMGRPPGDNAKRENEMGSR
jgi:hypothetical protein